MSAITVTHAEMKGFPQEDILEDRFVAVRQLKCAWNDRWTLVGQLAADGGHLYPYRPDTGARAITAKPRPFGKQTRSSPGIAQYPAALVTVVYSNASKVPRLINGVWVTESLEPNCETFTLPRDQLRWGSGSGTPLQLDESPGFLLPGLSYVVTFHRLAALPAGVGLQNVVNNAPFTSFSLGVTFPAETLMFSGATAQRDLQLGTDNCWKVAFRFGVRWVGWNKHWRVATQSFEYIYHKGQSEPWRRYQPVAFSAFVP